MILNNFLYCILKANFYWFTNYFHLRWSSHFNLYFQYVTCVPMTRVKMVRHVTIHQDLTPVSVKMVGMEAIVQKVNILLILDFRSFIDPIGLGLRLWCWVQLSTILQLYRGDPFYCWKKPEYSEKTTHLPQFTNVLAPIRKALFCNKFSYLYTDNEILTFYYHSTNSTWQIQIICWYFCALRHQIF